MLFPSGHAKIHESDSYSYVLRFSAHMGLSEMSVPQPGACFIKGSKLSQVWKFTEYLIVLNGRTKNL